MSENRIINRRVWFGFLIVTVLASVGLIIFPIGLARQIPAFILLWFLPAISWASFVKGERSERIIFGAGIALALNCLLVLIIALIPGEFSWYLGLFSAVFVSLLPLIHPREKLSTLFPASRSKRIWLFTLLLLILTLFLRLPNMGYKEIQGDEGIILARAAETILGDDSELFLHQKGPMELLLPMAAWSLAGATNDYWARLPFVWAGILSVFALYGLAERWFDDSVALTSVLLYTIGGFAIAFSRIIQYQSLVILLVTLASLCATRYRDRGRQSDLLLGAFFAGASILAHYDALLFMPAIGWLIISGIRNQGPIRWKLFVGATLLVLVVVGVFYLPFILNSNFQRTFSYLIEDRVGINSGTTVLGYGISRAWHMATFYNSTWYVLGIGALALVGLLVAMRIKGQLAAILYFAVPFLFYTVIVSDPRTHIYTVFPGGVILAGVGLSHLWENARSRGRRGLSFLGIGLFALWYLISLIYPVLLFIDVTPERQRTWSDNRPIPWLYATTWEEPPQYGLFGFPHQAGWRAVPDLLANSTDFPYASNEEEEITNWYMAQAERTHCQNFESLLIAKNTQDTIPVASEWFKDLKPMGQITVQGEPRLEIYQRNAFDEPTILAADEKTRWIRPEDMIPTLPPDLKPVDEVFDGLIKLIGYTIDNGQVVPGETVSIVLYWQALGPIEQNKQVFVHLYDGQMIAQHDGAPECGLMPTTRWEEGQIIVDPHVLRLPEGLPQGSIPLYTGLYDLLSGDRMRLAERNDDSILLTEVDVVKND